jgi:AcrR family transcriptional regulator
MRKSTDPRGAPGARPAADEKSQGRDKQKGRTRSALLTAAARLLAGGSTPTVADVADAADVSRRTAYRYFTTQEQLLVEAALEGLRPKIESAIAGPTQGDKTNPVESVETRLDRTVLAVQRNAVENEALLRTMIRLTVGPFDANQPEPTAPLRRGYRRIEWIELALAPAKSQLAGKRYERLVAALTVCLGIDALIVLRDLCGMSSEGAESVSRWMAQALLHASLTEGPATSKTPGAKKKRARGAARQRRSR